jgi:hypothetical protein
MPVILRIELGRVKRKKKRKNILEVARSSRALLELGVLRLCIIVYK